MGAQHGERGTRDRLTGPGVIVGLAVVLFVMRLLGPWDLMTSDQERPAAYALNVLENGHWAVPYDFAGAVASKPPLSTWLIVLASLPNGQLTRLSLYLPNLLAMTVMALVVYRWGRAVSGPVGLIGAGVLLLSPFGIKHLALARSDAVFAMLVTISAALALQVRLRGWSWIPFGVATAMATLAKGPLGVLLALLGLVPILRRPSNSGEGEMAGCQRLIGWSIIPAIGVFTLFVGGWLTIGWFAAGQALIDKMILDELLGHAASSGKGAIPGVHFYKSPLYFLSRFLPWSILTIVGLWKVAHRRSADPKVAMLERFLFSWFVLGLALFSLSPHQRADLLLPILPPAAFFAARAIDGMVQPWSIRARRLGAAVVLACAVGGSVVWRYELAPRYEPDYAALQRIEALADRLEAIDLPAPLVHTGDRSALQILLGTSFQRITMEEAASMLDRPEFVAVAARRADELIALTSDPDRCRIVDGCEIRDGVGISIIANRETIPGRDEDLNSAFDLNGVRIVLRSARFEDASFGRYTFKAMSPSTELVLNNRTGQDRSLTIGWLHPTGDRPEWQRIVLSAGQELSVRPNG